MIDLLHINLELLNFFRRRINLILLLRPKQLVSINTKDLNRQKVNHMAHSQDTVNKPNHESKHNITTYFETP